MFYKDLEAWKESILLVEEIYVITQQFPKEELYGISSQMRRAAVSIPSNIAEGSVRSSKKETSHFIDISIGSTAELDTQLIISQRLGYNIDTAIFDRIKKVNALLQGLKKYLTKLE